MHRYIFILLIGLTLLSIGVPRSSHDIGLIERAYADDPPLGGGEEGGEGAVFYSVFASGSLITPTENSSWDFDQMVPFETDNHEVWIITDLGVQPYDVMWEMWISASSVQGSVDQDNQPPYATVLTDQNGFWKHEAKDIGSLCGQQEYHNGPFTPPNPPRTVSSMSHISAKPFGTLSLLSDQATSERHFKITPN